MSVENPLAFPSTEEHPSYDFPMHHFGMTLRDYFAAKVIPATLIAMSNGRHDVKSGLSTLESAAIDSYAVADAMLAARGGS